MIINGLNVRLLNYSPGDFITVNSGRNVMADILIIKSSNESGNCFIDTKNLDGEGNLKEKISIRNIRNNPI